MAHGSYARPAGEPSQPSPASGTREEIERVLEHDPHVTEVFLDPTPGR
jgi:hypothetical protein